MRLKSGKESKQSVISGIQVDTNYEWEASEQMPTPSSRNIWTS